MSETASEYLMRVQSQKLASKPLTRARLEAEKACGDATMVRRNFFIPEYQREYLSIIAKANGITMAAALRCIVDEWVAAQLEASKG